MSAEAIATIKMKRKAKIRSTIKTDEDIAHHTVSMTIPKSASVRVFLLYFHSTTINVHYICMLIYVAITGVKITFNCYITIHNTHVHVHVGH